jgi:hypothetical protein
MKVRDINYNIDIIIYNILFYLALTPNNIATSKFKVSKNDILSLYQQSPSLTTPMMPSVGLTYGAPHYSIAHQNPYATSNRLVPMTTAQSVHTQANAPYLYQQQPPVPQAPYQTFSEQQIHLYPQMPFPITSQTVYPQPPTYDPSQQPDPLNPFFPTQAISPIQKSPSSDNSPFATSVTNDTIPKTSITSNPETLDPFANLASSILPSFGIDQTTFGQNRTNFPSVSQSASPTPSSFSPITPVRQSMSSSVNARLIQSSSSPSDPLEHKSSMYKS